MLLRDARENLRGARRTLVKDLDEMQKAAAGKRPAAAKRAPAKRTTTTKRAGAASSRKPSTRATRKT